MISTGEFYKRVPKERVANLKFRRSILKQCQNNPANQQAIMYACRQDLLFFIAVFGFQFNPDEDMTWKVGPFIPYEFQERALLATLKRWVEERKDAVWEKSRKMGASWMALFLEVWPCLFHSWQKFIDISHSEKAVDEPGGSGSLFWKINFIHEHLPDWMTKGVKKRKMGFVYPETDSAITGAASTGRSGVGDRGNVLLDELGKQVNAYAILGQTADTGPRLMISTHYGVGTAFYDLCERPDIFKIVMHWSQHPTFRKGLYRWNHDEKKIEFLDDQFKVVDQPTYPYPDDYQFVTDGTPTGGPFPGIRSFWYDEECSRRGNKRDVAMHLDINATGADAQFFDGVILNQLKLNYCEYPKWEGDIHYDKETGQPITLVQKAGGPLRLWRLPDHAGKFPLSKYGAGADLSTGSGATPSCLSIGDALTCEKILEYADAHIGGEKFAPKAIAICRLFKGHNRDGALLAWEQQGPGVMFGKRVLELGYRNIYYRTAEMPTTLNPEVSNRPGWNASPDNKLLLLEEYRAGLQGRLFINRSFEAIKECPGFRYNSQGKVEQAKSVSTNEPESARENHSDLVIADALCYKMLIQLGLTKVVKKDKEHMQIGSWAWRRKLTDDKLRQMAEDYY